ncbi:cupin [Flavivirga aquatica]|uniref:Cupin n=1 Tax=Flavivirga aquatica TaxID=1849968 RepID=A0A1E5TCJ8_9FLAO|nr:cupin domain-containing protein [Flavivirga aquatica]OEK09094.1 cupin [Flavivirga aquatica]
MKSIYIFTLLITCLFSSCKTHQNLKTEVVKLSETTKSWNGDDLPEYLDGKPKITILKITIPPHTKLKVHKHLVINAGVLLKGELLVVDEHNNTLNLKAGNPIVELVNTFHHGENNTNKPAEIIVFYAGNVDVPITVLKDGNASGSNH